MKIILFSSIITVSKFLVDICLQEKKRIYSYISIFFLVCFILFIFKETAHASYISPSSTYIPNAKIEQKFFNLQATLSPADKRDFQEKMKFHEDNGLRCYNDAKNRCWWLPQISDREAAKYCFTSAAVTLGSKTLRCSAVSALVSLLISYGLEANDEWWYIQNKLSWSEYHFDMCDWYYNVLNNA